MRAPVTAVGLRVLLFAVLSVSGCADPPADGMPLHVPVLEVQDGERVYRFGPFVGYYFRPQAPGDLSRLEFVCFNQRRFYTRDLPENALLYEGQAVLTRLPGGALAAGEGRIQPVFFEDAPVAWLDSRPEPRDEFLHFHSCYDAQGPVLVGYWLRHVAAGDFTYDMGGRVGPESPLFHRVKRGVDRAFARIVEFDRGPR